MVGIGEDRMILKSLSECYDILKSEDKMPNIGYCEAKVSQIVELNYDGTIHNILPCNEKFEVPLQKKRTRKIEPYFLCDLPKYFFGKEKKDKSINETLDYEVKSRLLHIQILSNINSDRAEAMINFFRLKGKNLDYNFDILDYCENKLTVFKLKDDDKFIHEDEQIKEAWEKYLLEDLKKEGSGQCLISGKTNEAISRIHNSFKLAGGAPSGVSVVCFNEDAYCSYNKTQSYNAPISFTEMSKYVAALKYLTTSENNVCHLSEFDIIFWSDVGSDVLETKIIKEFFGYYDADKKEKKSNDKEEEDEGVDIATISDTTQLAQAILLSLCNCQEDEKINQILEDHKDTKVFLIGLSPNKSRTIPQLYYQVNFKLFIEKIKTFYKKIYLGKTLKEPITVTNIIRSTTRTGKLKDAYGEVKSPLISSILDGTNYSVYLIQFCQMYYEMNFNSPKNDTPDYKLNLTRMAILKGYLIQLGECLDVKLDENNLNVGYNLGRLFAVIEHIQTQIKDKYIKDSYINVCNNTHQALNNLLNLNAQNLEKLTLTKDKPKLAYYYEKMLADIMKNIDVEKIPRRLSGKDALYYHFGYAHQKDFIFTKKEPIVEDNLEEVLDND